MKYSDFVLDAIFWCGDRQWRCTDIGTRTIVAIRIDSVAVGGNAPELHRTLSRAEAEAAGWFNGPPYAVAETVFDEDDIEACTTESPEGAAIDAESLADEPERRDEEAAEAGRAQARALRDQARAGGLRFAAYLPSTLADWILDKVERGVFSDPSEAVFVILGEYRELEPYTDLREELERRILQAAIDDPRPGIPHEEVVALMAQWAAAPRPVPAVWRRPS